MASEESRILDEVYQSLAQRGEDEPDMSIATMRDVYDSLHKVTPEPTGVTYEEFEARGVPVIRCLPEGAATDRALLHFHGGGFMVCSKTSDRKLGGHIAKAIGVPTLVVDFRLAPEHPFPAQLEDALAVYQWVLESGIRPEHVATVGHSAGGNLCTSMVVAMPDRNLPRPAAVMPISAWYDMELRGGTMDSNAHLDAIVQRPILEGMREAFLAGREPDEPLANPLYADLTGFPPVLLHTGAYETLVDDAVRFEERARSFGVDVTSHLAPEMQHSYPLLAGRAPEADEALNRMREWVRPRLGL